MFSECCERSKSLGKISTASISSFTPCFCAFSALPTMLVSYLFLLVLSVSLKLKKKKTIGYLFAYLHIVSLTQPIIIRFTDQSKKTYLTHDFFEIVTFFPLIFFHGRYFSFQLPFGVLKSLTLVLQPFLNRKLCSMLSCSLYIYAATAYCKAKTLGLQSPTSVDLLSHLKMRNLSQRNEFQIA